MSARIGIVQLFALCLDANVIVAYANDGYLRGVIGPMEA
jgi:hypothetical protein